MRRWKLAYATLISSFFIFTLSFVQPHEAQADIANVTGINLDMTVTVGGRVQVGATFVNANGTPESISGADSCTLEVFAVMSSENGVTTASAREVASRRLRGGATRTAVSSTAIAKRMRAVNDVDNQNQVMSVQARLDCGGSNTFVSAPVARFFVCGRFANRSDDAARALRRLDSQLRIRFPRA